MDDNTDLTQLHLDVYATREGRWHPEHGEIEIPDDWEFLPSGDTFVTRTVKAAGSYWIAWRPRGRNRPHRRRLGLWAPKAAIEAAIERARETEAERAKRREKQAADRARREESYQKELTDEIRQFLRFAPEHAALADEIARGAAEQAAVVGSGRVGRTQKLSIEERASLAARAYIRHTHTDYEDALDDLVLTDTWDDEWLYREVKDEAQRAVDEFLDRHRFPQK